MSAQRILDKLFIAAFAVSLIFPMASAFYPDEQDDAWFATIEKRTAASFPVLTRQKDRYRLFATGFESYFDDHMGLRRKLIQFRNEVELSVFHKSISPLVVLGKGDWLFYNDTKSADGFLGLAPLEQSEMDRLRRSIEQRRDWLAKQGIAYIFLIAPDKQTIHAENLPDTLQGDRAMNRVSTFLAHMQGSDAERNIVYPADSLFAAKPAGDLYYHRDSHWNAFGAYAAYRVTMDRLAGTLGTNVDALVLRRGEIVDDNAPDGPRGGDLAVMSGVRPKTAVPISFAGRACIKPAIPPVVPGTVSGPNTDYAFFCDSDVHKQRLLLFHDSFGSNLIPFYAASFSYLRTSARRPTFEDLVQYVAAEHPTVVIEEHVERYFWPPELSF